MCTGKRERQFLAIDMAITIYVDRVKDAPEFLFRAREEAPKLRVLDQSVPGRVYRREDPLDQVVRILECCVARK